MKSKSIEWVEIMIIDIKLTLTKKMKYVDESKKSKRSKKKMSEEKARSILRCNVIRMSNAML